MYEIEDFSGVGCPRVVRMSFELPSRLVQIRKVRAFSEFDSVFSGITKATNPD